MLILCTWLSSTGRVAAQDNRITGNVADDRGMPLIGVNVVEKGTTNGTVTDINGNYSLQIPADATLVYSYIGYASQEVLWNGEIPLNIVLQDDSEMLGELVVIGYGTQRKLNLSGAVDQVGIKELEAKPITNIAQGLQGMVPNLNIEFYQW